MARCYPCGRENADHAERDCPMLDVAHRDWQGRRCLAEAEELRLAKLIQERDRAACQYVGTNITPGRCGNCGGHRLDHEGTVADATYECPTCGHEWLDFVAVEANDDSSFVCPTCGDEFFESSLSGALGEPK